MADGYKKNMHTYLQPAGVISLGRPPLGRGLAPERQVPLSGVERLINDAMPPQEFVAEPMDFEVPADTFADLLPGESVVEYRNAGPPRPAFRSYVKEIAPPPPQAWNTPPLVEPRDLPAAVDKVRRLAMFANSGPLKWIGAAGNVAGLGGALSPAIQRMQDHGPLGASPTGSGMDAFKAGLLRLMAERGR